MTKISARIFDYSQAINLQQLTKLSIIDNRIVVDYWIVFCIESILLQMNYFCYSLNGYLLYRRALYESLSMFIFFIVVSVGHSCL